MKIVILSRNPRSYSTNRLREAAKERGHIARVMDTLKFSIFIEEGSPDLRYANRAFPEFDAVIPRIGASITFFGTAVLRQMEQMGLFALNGSVAIANSRDKLRAFQILSRHRIGLPQTAFVREKRAVLPAIEHVGGAPVIVKLLEGTQGTGVILSENKKIAQAVVETLQSAKQNVLIQKFVKESKGKDLRAFVVGDRVVAAMRRTAIGDEFRSNVHRGGEIESVTLEPAFERTAILAAHIMGLRVAGVDMLESDNGPQIMEINSSPGLEGIEAASGVDIAGEIIDYMEGRVMLPDVDIRQRLSLKAGYLIAEIPIMPESELAHKTLAECQLKDRDVLLLNIVRGDISIPNPKSSEEILPGDTLICFGKMLTLKGLAPKHRPKRIKKKKARAAKR